MAKAGALCILASYWSIREGGEKHLLLSAPVRPEEELEFSLIPKTFIARGAENLCK